MQAQQGALEHHSAYQVEQQRKTTVFLVFRIIVLRSGNGAADQGAFYEGMRASAQIPMQSRVCTNISVTLELGE